MEERATFKTKNAEGVEIECEVLLTFQGEETGKHYMVYTDNTIDEAGNTRVFAATFDPTKSEQTMYPIETEAEWKIIETVLETISQEGENEQ